MDAIRAGIIGATGFAGAELARLLALHPRFEVIALTAGAEAGMEMGALYPALEHAYRGVQLVPHHHESLFSCDVVFTAVPHTAGMQHAARLIERGISVIDLSADFRFNDVDRYERTYEVSHTAPQLARRAVYGQPETMRERLHEAARERENGMPALVGCAGCYVTASILAAAPALAAGLVEPCAPLVVDGVSGVTGAGRKATARTHFCTANENIEAYGLPAHRHAPEIAQAYSRLMPSLGSAEDIRLAFAPHLVPLNRGLLATVHLPLATDIDPAELHATYCSFFSDSPLVTVLDQDVLPKTAAVAGTAYAQVNATVDKRTRIACALCAIDNLGKGAAAQAVQCANLIFELPENTGLDAIACIP
ncbi:MAG: N-acetyl-gamma-glutamyl-phosphate reductase [Slackia sp.]|nr:N-acetyl-gamma-glutamyl-phosphate reductase [Slackia sp.]